MCRAVSCRYAGRNLVRRKSLNRLLMVYRERAVPSEDLHEDKVCGLCLTFGLRQHTLMLFDHPSELIKVDVHYVLPGLRSREVSRLTSRS
jgi:hypothetical protein